MTDPSQMDAVLDAVARGDSAAFMQVVQAHGLMLRSYIGAQVFNSGDAEDLAQETFIAAYRALHSFRAEVAEIVGGELESASAGDRHEHIEALLRCITKLPEKLRRVVHAGLDGMKVPALAEALQTSTGAVYQLHYRANQLLRECVQKEVQHV